MFRALTPTLAAAVLLAACGTTAEQHRPASAERPAPATTGPASNGTLASGGVDEFERRLAALKGRPVVVNQWASWCPPCRFEFPFFRRVAERYAGKVAFLGVNSGDERSAAEDFLRGSPTPYPHLEDPDAEIAREFGGGRTWPTTAFYGPDGEVRHVMPGGYPSEERLEADVRRYALDG